MTIRSLCVVKDEADVLTQTLTSALQWSDEILVLDNGSTDGTWELVTELAAREPRVIAVGREERPFFDDIRVSLFDARKDSAVEGDWWCRLDADEFYVDDPRAVLAAVAPGDFSVWSASLSYYFTDRDAARYESNPAAFADDIPVEDRCRYYLNHWSEPRFFRHLPGLSWRVGDGGFPRALWDRTASPQRIVLKHFAYRSPQQIQRRLDARRISFAEHPEFSHEAVVDWAEAVAGIRRTGRFAGTPGAAIPADWKARIVSADALDYDAQDGHFVLNEDLMPPLPHPRTAAARLNTKLRGLARKVRARAT
ncbi:glycosyltransferase family 2 protein [Leifsonia sp. 2MCAF36]|uniref:glycosyltransferase family 2 protein n=1 Tax=Leifsonia sp. 2MCAF36 TaxID=3232988 RepID=UPI003F96566C